MASWSRKKAERPHFFKIILDDSIPQQKLGIPNQFVKTYGDDLSSPVMLKVPSGVKWKIEIVKSDGEIWLQNGWPEFAEYYSIAHGSFLVFEYEKSECKFNVIIFDKSATEIDYPFSFSNEGDNIETRPDNLDQEQVPQEPNVDEVKEDISVETLASRKTKAKFPISVHPTPNNKKINKTSNRYCPTAQVEERQKANRSLTRKTPPVKEEKTKNPSFRIVMQPLHVQKRKALVVPPSFARKHLNKSGDAILNVFDGRTWPIKYYSRTSFGITKTRIEHFGWNKFVKDVRLKVGDVCMFELIDRVKTMFGVVKNSNAANRCTKTSHEKESSSKQPKLSFSNPPEAGKKCTSANPSFQARISSACLRGSIVYVPNSFIKNVGQGTKYTMLKVNNRCWPVKLIYFPEFGTGLLSAGWTAFARENSLKVGDVCTFELIARGETPLVSVSIIRNSGICLETNGDDEEAEPKVPNVEETTTETPVEGRFSSGKRKKKLPLSFSQPRKIMKKGESLNETTRKAMKKYGGVPDQKKMGNPIFTMEKPYLTLKGKTKAIDKGRSSCQSENPTFQVVIHPSHVNNQWLNPHIPACFVRKYMKRKDGTAVLNSLDGRKWSVKYWTKRLCGRMRTKIMHSDWQNFVRDNHLQVGDICTFELINPDKAVFTVLISKSRVATNLCKNKQSMGKEISTGERVRKPSFSYFPEAANKKLTSGNPFFELAMTSSNLMGTNVHVPHKFIKNLKQVTQNMKLQVGNRFWTVKLNMYPHYTKSSLSGGWIGFVRENCLKEGDVCSFELIDTQNLLIKVSISRNMSSN